MGGISNKSTTAPGGFGSCSGFNKRKKASKQWDMMFDVLSEICIILSNAMSHGCIDVSLFHSCCPMLHVLTLIGICTRFPTPPECGVY